MKNIHTLPTEKPSRIIKSQDNDFILLNTDAPNWLGINLKTTKQNIYTTSDEEIREGYVLHLPTYRILEVGVITESNGSKSFREKEYHINGIEVLICDCKKIILTTDQDLIAGGVQAIDDKFLQWFVKNPSCEEVEVIKYEDDNSPMLVKDKTYYYKIIIPKEELYSKIQQKSLELNKKFAEHSDLEKIMSEFDEHKQETPEEVADRFFEEQEKLNFSYDSRESFAEGYKLAQERMYSAEELKSWLAHRDLYLYNYYTTYIKSGIPLESVEDFIKDHHEYLMGRKQSKRK